VTGVGVGTCLREKERRYFSRTEFWHPTRNDPRISAALVEALALETPSKVQMGVLPLPDPLELLR
jgi:hypothetical protein